MVKIQETTLYLLIDISHETSSILDNISTLAVVFVTISKSIILFYHFLIFVNVI